MFSPYNLFRGFKKISLSESRIAIYNNNPFVLSLLERNVYTIPYPKRKGLTRLKKSMFFSKSNVAYGEAVVKAWKYLENSYTLDVETQQEEINKIFYNFFPEK
jgi:hypothetical protein